MSRPVLDGVFVALGAVAQIPLELEAAARGTPVVVSLSAYGLLGAILAWFMTKHDKKIDKLAHNINGLRMAILADVATRNTCTPQLREMVQEMLNTGKSRSGG